MERLCIEHERDRGLGCFVEMVQSDVGEYVRYEDASAEIARLRADLARLRAIEAAAKRYVHCCEHHAAWASDLSREAVNESKAALLKAVKP